MLMYDRLHMDAAQLYLPASHPAMDDAAPTALLIRTAGPAQALVPAIRRVVQSLRPDMPFVPVDTLEARVAPQLRPWQLGTTMFVLFGGVALLIAAVGLYSAMVYAVAQRTHEIGVRLALGASRAHVVGQVGRRAAVTIAGGLGIGLIAAAGAARWIAGLLFETSPRDGWVYVSVAGVLGVAGLAAAIVPVRRSAAVDPLSVLRTE